MITRQMAALKPPRENLINPSPVKIDVPTTRFNEPLHCLAQALKIDTQQKMKMITHQYECVNSNIKCKANESKVHCHNRPDVRHFRSKPIAVNATSSNVIRKFSVTDKSFSSHARDRMQTDYLTGF